MSAQSADQAIQSGFALVQEAQHEAAEQIAHTVLKAKKNHGNAMALLGRIAFDRGRYEDAANWHRKASMTDRKSAPFLCNLANSLMALSRVGDALSAFERAVKIKPDYAPAVAGLADALERRGKTKRAIQVLKPYIDSGKATGKMLNVFARAEQSLGNHDSVIRICTQAAEDSRLRDTARGNLLLLAGRSYDATDDADRAFDCFQRGQALVAQPFDIAETKARHDAMIATFSVAVMETLPRATHGSELPIFIVGMPRTGSTLIEQILHAHPEAHGAGEISDLSDALRAVPETIAGAEPFPACAKSLTSDDLNRIAKLYLDSIRTCNGRANRIVDKALYNFDRLGMIAMLFPEARIIHAVRNPLDTCLSCFLHRLPPTLHPYTSDLTSCGQYYREYHRMMEHWRSVPGIRMLDVRYEELINDQEGVTRTLLEFCGLAWDEKCLDFHQAKRDVATLSYDQVRRPIYKSAVNRHARYEKHLGPLREALGDLA